MESPFGFIEGFQMAAEADRDAKSRQADFEERTERNDWFHNLPPGLWEKVEAMDPVERVVERQVDVISHAFAQKMGYDDVPWFRLTWMLLMIYLILTVLVMFYKADFVNLTVGVTALYMMFNPETITRSKFRVLVLGIFLTIIYDTVWLIMKHSELAADDKSSGDGGAEKSVRTFALCMAYLSFAVRVSYFIANINFLVHHRYCFLERFKRFC